MNYKEFIESQKDESKIYAMVLNPSEDRGGASKPAAIWVGDNIPALEKATKLSAYDDLMIMEVRNGALFFNYRLHERLHDGDGDSSLMQKVSDPNASSILMDIVRKMTKWDSEKGGTAKKLVNKEINPDGWWTLIGRGDECDECEDGEEIGEKTEEESININNGFLFLLTNDENRSHELWYFTNFVHCLKIWAGLDSEGSGEQVDIFRIKDGEATLLLSNAAIETGVDFKTTGMSCYDYAYNPVKQCNYGCKYCFAEKGGIKDFRCLPEDLKDRVIIGSTCDPYQKVYPVGSSVIRHLLEKMLTMERITKVGIFTKSPLVVGDLDIIKKLPNPVIHLNVSPFKEEMRKLLEPNAPTNSERLEAAKKIKEAGIKLVINFCPCMPEISSPEGFEEFFELADEICIGLTMMYAGIPESLSTVLPASVIKTMTEKATKKPWELQFMKAMQKAMKKWSSKKLVIWRDTGRKGWKNLADLTPIPQEFYSA